MVSDGIVPEQVPLRKGDTTLAALRDAYLKAHRGSLEDTTISGIQLHFKHLCRILGEPSCSSKISIEPSYSSMLITERA